MNTPTENNNVGTSGKPYHFWKHLNQIRWLCLSLVFLMLILIPIISIYQHYVAAHAYRNLDGGERMLYHSMELITAPFVTEPKDDLDALKGTTWSGQLFGLKLSDPLAAVGQTAAAMKTYWPFILTALLPIFFTLIFGRFFCSWICPASFLYELNSNFSIWLTKLGLKSANLKLDRRIKYLVLGLGTIASSLMGFVVFASFYPPAVIGRELYFSIALSGFGGASFFIIGTLLFDLLVAKRGICRYLCPGGALYSLLGRYRPVRVKRIVETCTDCAKCNSVCEFALNPMRGDFGQECSNCTACIAVCPQDSLTMTLAFKDQSDQGPGHLSRETRSQQP